MILSPPALLRRPRYMTGGQVLGNGLFVFCSTAAQSALLGAIHLLFILIGVAPTHSAPPTKISQNYWLNGCQIVFSFCCRASSPEWCGELWAPCRPGSLQPTTHRVTATSDFQTSKPFRIVNSLVLVAEKRQFLKN